MSQAVMILVVLAMGRASASWKPQSGLPVLPSTMAHALAAIPAGMAGTTGASGLGSTASSRTTGGRGCCAGAAGSIRNRAMRAMTKGWSLTIVEDLLIGY